MLLPVLLVATSLAAVTPGTDLSPRELAGLGVTTDHAWLLQETKARVLESADDVQANVRLEQAVRSAAQLAQRSATHTRRPEQYRHALALIDLYLASWPEADAAYRFTWTRAELLWDLGEYEDAALAYHATVRFADAGNYRFSAARNELLAWEKVAAVRDGDERRFAQRNLLEAADRYVLLTVHVTNPKVRALRADAAFKAFSVLADHDVAGEAKARAFDLLRMGEAATPHARTAARILIDKTALWHGERAASDLACTLRRDARLVSDEATMNLLDDRCPRH